MTEWWIGIPDAVTRVDCGGEAHTLRWHAGELHALAHEDVEGERALAALGGEPCACVDVLDAWTRHADDLRVLMLASRGPADELDVPVDREEAEDELVDLLALGGGLADRLVASVAAAWADRSEAELTAVRARLAAALYGRVVPELRRWLGEPSLDIDLEMNDREGERSIRRLDDHRLRVELPFAWISEVWCRGVASVCGRLCLRATIDDRGERWTLHTLGADLLVAQPVTLTVPVSGA
jgi:hypothetical protein